MLRRTQTSWSLSSFSDPCLPRVLNRVTPGRLEATLIFLKERRKRYHYQGTEMAHFNDRMQLYVARGGVKKGTRFIVEPHHNRVQYFHRGAFKGKYDIRTVKTAGVQHDMMGNFTRTAWDLSICSTDTFSNGNQKKLFHNMSKQEAVERVEAWGVRYIMLDEIRKPSLEDSKYHTHSLFAHKFYWSPFPETNHRVGEADFKWRGDELIAYEDYGASSADAKNRFHSLWKKTVSKATAAAPKPAAPTTAAKA